MEFRRNSHFFIFIFINFIFANTQKSPSNTKLGETSTDDPIIISPILFGDKIIAGFDNKIYSVDESSNIEELETALEKDCFFAHFGTAIIGLACPSSQKLFSVSFKDKSIVDSKISESTASFHSRLVKYVSGSKNEEIFLYGFEDRTLYTQKITYNSEKFSLEAYTQKTLDEDENNSLLDMSCEYFKESTLVCFFALYGNNNLSLKSMYSDSRTDQLSLSLKNKNEIKMMKSIKTGEDNNFFILYYCEDDFFGHFFQVNEEKFPDIFPEKKTYLTVSSPVKYDFYMIDQTDSEIKVVIYFWIQTSQKSSIYKVTATANNDPEETSIDLSVSTDYASIIVKSMENRYLFYLSDKTYVYKELCTAYGIDVELENKSNTFTFSFSDYVSTSECFENLNLEVSLEKHSSENETPFSLGGTPVTDGEKYPITSNFLYKYNYPEDTLEYQYTIYYREKYSKTFKLKFLFTCYSFCSTCENKGNEEEHECTGCRENYYFLKENEIVTNNCLWETEKGYYRKDDYMYSCPSSCTACAFNEDSNIVVCSECKSGLFLTENQPELYCLKDPEIGYYNDGSGVFKKCDLSCKSCDKGPTEDNKNCKECASNFYKLEEDSEKVEFSCYDKLDRYYLSENLLKKCYETCQSCSKGGNEKEHNCELCLEESYYFLEEHKTPDNCFSKDKAGYYLDGNVLKKCHKNCKTCSEEGNDSQNNCDECIENYYPLEDDPNNCYSLGPDEYRPGYFLSDNILKNCYKNCKKCTEKGTDLDQKCDECIDGFYYKFEEKEKNCYDKENTNHYYLDEEENKLKECHKNCLKCSKGGDDDENNCGTCIDNFYKKSEEEPRDNCYTGTIDGYYLDSGEYKKCYETCLSCSSRGDENTHLCIHCVANYYKKRDAQDEESTNCFEYPLTHFYLEEGVFIECNEECKECNKEGCTECEPNKFFYENQKKCYEECPSDTFSLEQNNIKKCVDKCPSQYYEDSGVNKCVNCAEENKYLLYDRNICSDNIVDGYYISEEEEDKGFNVLKRCHSSCATCLVKGDNDEHMNCETCSEGLLLTKEKNCVKKCPSLFGNYEGNCIKCYDEKKQYLLDGNCVSDKKGYYVNPDNEGSGELLQCYNTCETCNKGSEEENSVHNCDSCKQEFKFKYGTNCYSICPDNLYHHTTDKEEENIPCKTCDGSYSEINESKKECYICYISDNYFYEGKCYEESKIPTNTYRIPNDDKKRLGKCDNSCKKCSAGAEEGNAHCTECNIGMILHESNCLKPNECPGKLYLVDDVKCDVCDPNKFYLDQENKKCVNCKDIGKYLLNIDDDKNKENNCYDRVLEGYYVEKDDENNVMKKCSKNCETCSIGEEKGENGILLENCDTCKGELINFKKQCLEICPEKLFLWEGDCIEKCPEDTRLDSEKRKCSICRNERGERIYYLNTTNECFEEKPEDTYDSIPDKKVITRCHENCGSCLKGGDDKKNNCIKCKENLLFYKDSCYKNCPEKYKYGTNCTDCPETYYPNSNDENNRYCQNCKDTGLKYYITEPKKPCVSEVSSHTYLFDEETNSYKECFESCKTCKNGSYDGCLSCIENMVLSFGRCLSDCEKGTFLLNGVCWKECPYYLYENKEDKICENCKTNGKYIYDRKEPCISSIDGYYMNDTNYNYVTKCQENCATCTGYGHSNFNNCDSCKDKNKILFNKHCYDKCPGNYYAYKGECTDCPSFTEKNEEKKQCILCHEVDKTTYLYQNKCKNIKSSKNKLEGYFFIDNKYYIVDKCYDSCKYCEEKGNSTEHKCLECNAGLKKFGSNCLKNCPLGSIAEGTTCKNCFKDKNGLYFRYNEGSEEGKCVNRDICTTSDVINDDTHFCTTCKKYKSESNNTCVSECNTNYCAVDYSQKLCKCCKELNMSFFEGECISECPYYTKSEGENKVCKLITGFCVVNCFNGGSLDKDNEKKCKCKDSFAGSFCEINIGEKKKLMIYSNNDAVLESSTNIFNYVYNGEKTINKTVWTVNSVSDDDLSFNGLHENIVKLRPYSLVNGTNTIGVSIFDSAGELIDSNVIYVNISSISKERFVFEFKNNLKEGVEKVTTISFKLNDIEEIKDVISFNYEIYYANSQEDLVFLAEGNEYSGVLPATNKIYLKVTNCYGDYIFLSTSVNIKKDENSMDEIPSLDGVFDYNKMMEIYSGVQDATDITSDQIKKINNNIINYISSLTTSKPDNSENQKTQNNPQNVIMTGIYINQETMLKLDEKSQPETEEVSEILDFIDKVTDLMFDVKTWKGKLDFKDDNYRTVYKTYDMILMLGYKSQEQKLLLEKTRKSFEKFETNLKDYVKSGEVLEVKMKYLSSYIFKLGVLTEKLQINFSSPKSTFRRKLQDNDIVAPENSGFSSGKIETFSLDCEETASFCISKLQMEVIKQSILFIKKDDLNKYTFNLYTVSPSSNIYFKINGIENPSINLRYTFPIEGRDTSSLVCTINEPGFCKTYFNYTSDRIICLCNSTGEVEIKNDVEKVSSNILLQYSVFEKEYHKYFPIAFISTFLAVTFVFSIILIIFDFWNDKRHLLYNELTSFQKLYSSFPDILTLHDLNSLGFGWLVTKYSYSLTGMIFTYEYNRPRFIRLFIEILGALVCFIISLTPFMFIKFNGRKEIMEKRDISQANYDLNNLPIGLVDIFIGFASAITGLILQVFIILFGEFCLGYNQAIESIWGMRLNLLKNFIWRNIICGTVEMSRNWEKLIKKIKVINAICGSTMIKIQEREKKKKENKVKEKKEEKKKPEKKEVSFIELMKIESIKNKYGRNQRYSKKKDKNLIGTIIRTQKPEHPVFYIEKEISIFCNKNDNESMGESITVSAERKKLSDFGIDTVKGEIVKKFRYSSFNAVPIEKKYSSDLLKVYKLRGLTYFKIKKNEVEVQQQTEEKWKIIKIVIAFGLLTPIAAGGYYLLYIMLEKAYEKYGLYIVKVWLVPVGVAILIIRPLFAWIYNICLVVSATNNYGKPQKTFFSSLAPQYIVTILKIKFFVNKYYNQLTHVRKEDMFDIDKELDPSNESDFEQSKEKII